MAGRDAWTTVQPDRPVVSRNDAPPGKPTGLSPATYRSPTSQRPTSRAATPDNGAPVSLRVMGKLTVRRLRGREASMREFELIPAPVGVPWGCFVCQSATGPLVDTQTEHQAIGRIYL